MYQSLDIFQTASAMARHSGTSQAAVARNIANADTPGFRAQGVTAFADTYRAHDTTTMRSTRPQHLHGVDAAQRVTSHSAQASEASPNGNTVSLEDELLQSVAISHEHNRALAVYRHSMTVLRTALGRS